MPTGVVKTKRDEHKWEKAKDLATDAGFAGNYAYIMGIYKKMKPDYEFKSAVQRLAATWLGLGQQTRTAGISEVAAAQRMLRNLLAGLRAAQQSHQTAHWQSGGPSFYGDHLMFERIYNGYSAEIDTLAEKMVAMFGTQAVDHPEQMVLQAFLTKEWGQFEDPFKRAYHIEMYLQQEMLNTYEALKDTKQITLGLDDFLMSMSSNHETHQYLLGQRMSEGLAKKASHRAAIRKVAGGLFDDIFGPQDDEPVEDPATKARWALESKLGETANMLPAAPMFSGNVNSLIGDTVFYFTRNRAWFIYVDAPASQAVARAKRAQKLLRGARSVRADQIVLRERTMYVGSNDGRTTKVEPLPTKEAAAQLKYEVSLFSTEPGGRALWTKQFTAPNDAVADERALELVKPQLNKYPDVEDWVVEPVGHRGKKAGGTLDAVQQFISRQRTWFEVDARDTRQIVISSREYGDPNRGRPGAEDEREARRLMDLIERNFQGLVTVDRNSSDEWTMVTIRLGTQGRMARNQKVIEAPHSFHPVKLEPAQAKRKEFPFEGFIDFQGLKIDVENACGSTRKGVGPEGEWSTYMHSHYGEIRGTEGTDGDKLDVYVGPNHDSSVVVVIHQHNPWDGKFDEDKVMIGFDSVEEAIGSYKKQYDRPGFYRDGEHTAMGIGKFWRWVHDKNNKGKKIAQGLKTPDRIAAQPDFATFARRVVIRMAQGFRKHPGPKFTWDTFPEMALQEVANHWANAHDLGEQSSSQIQKEYSDYVLRGAGRNVVLRVAEQAIQGKL